MPTAISAKLVSNKLRLGLQSGGIGVVLRVEEVVANKLVGLTVPHILTGPGGDVDNRARVAAIFGAEGRVVNFKLVHRINRRLEGDLILIWIAQIDAVDHVVDAILTPAGGVKCDGALPA